MNTRIDNPGQHAAGIPDTETILARDEYVIHPRECFDRRHLGSRTVITRGEGIYVYDSEGNKLIDGPGGMWCVNVGHGRADLAAAMAEQAATLAYYSPGVCPTSPPPTWGGAWPATHPATFPTCSSRPAARPRWTRRCASSPSTTT
ncbi:MAG: aminotransferase class III-fold pyridoxal phosphate-dependent enzyme [Gammaproteobacteria bacterium]|nr:aminotransferase class III-fold pyridoxal phosphate-dependent enzyme [Gammaproteobacteria bacterium]